jgi:thiol-disulfide isomerase/thioredoxin
MKRLLSLLILGLGATLAYGCSKTERAEPVARVVEQSPAPDITVHSLENRPRTLSELRGKVVLLNFWATWCPPCRQEIPSMMRLNSAMSGKPFEMIAVSVDEGGKAAVEAFFQSSGLRLPAYIDPDGRASKAYGTTGVPESFIIDKNGVVVKKVIGAMSWDRPDVVSYLESLMK